MMIGDLILYRSTGRWYERLITLATHGPFVHVAIVVDESRVLAARARGIGYEPLSPEDALHTVVSLAGRASDVGINVGLAWAMRQAGKEYGWLDIVYQAVKFVWPGNPLRFGEEGHYDCSDFACRYLIHAGVQLPDSCLDSYTVTPNDLARVFGVLPAEKMVKSA